LTNRFGHDAEFDERLLYRCALGCRATYDGGVFKDASGNLYAGSETGVFKGSTACGAWVAINNGLPN
jgi:hypothetical protein